MSKSVLVTGGAGFVGSHLCEKLHNLGHSVTSIDNYFTGSIKNHINGVHYVSGDVATINDVFKARSFDLVYHMGEYSRVEQSFDDVQKVLDFNTKGINEVLKYCMSKGSKLIYAGSSTKYGDNGADSSPYAFTKAKNTELVRNFGEWFGLNFAITYFYNVYGCREIETGAYATVIAKFKKLKQEGKPLPVVLPGTQLRNFTHITDIVNGLILVGENGSGDGYAIGNSKAYSILEVAELFDSELELLPERRGNRMSASLDTSKIKSLGWSETVNLEEYIRGCA
jgi:UDP-glucose 4-epimerase